MKKHLLLMIFLFFALASLKSQAQSRPFPQNVTYAYGLMAANRNAADASATYNSWKASYLAECSNGRYRVKFDDPNQTVSEGIAYGMLLTAYAADRTIFDGLWQYYKDNRNTNGVMNWKINGCSGTIGANGATDAELDAAMALIVAHTQWGSTGSINYQTDAQALIAAIKAHEIEAGTAVLKPGDAFGGSQLTNPSYFAPAYYRAYGQFTNDATFWNGVASKAYEVINNNLNANGGSTTGLVSDWAMADGSHAPQASGYFSGGTRFHYDACRTPWRIATDYLWHGTVEAKTYATKVANFVKNTLGGSANIKDGYYQNGSVYGQYHNAVFVGAFASAAMAVDNTSDYQNHLNSSYTDLKDRGNDNYFNTTLKALYLFLQTGNFYLPSSGSATPIDQPTFEVTSDKPSVSVAPGASATTSITVGAFSGFSGDILLSITGLPAGVTASSFSPASLSGSGTTTLTLSANTTATAGTATVNVTAQSGSVTGTTALPITVEAASTPPFSVTLSVPANTVFTAGETIQLTPTASGGDGTISKVAFYQGSTLLGESTTSPFTFAWTNVPAGSHALMAKAYDNAGTVATSEVVSLSVAAAPSPGFRLSSSSSAVSLVAGSSMEVSVTVEALGGFSAAVDLSVGGLPTGVTAVFSPASLPSGSSQLSLTASSSATVGSSSLTLTGRSGATTHTASLSLSVSAVGTPPNQPPTVQLNTPSPDAIVVAGQDLMLTAEASDADGTVSKVEFYQGSTLLAESTTSPYTFAWTNVPAGSHALTAKAYDNAGKVATSAVITISVQARENAVLVEAGVQPRPWFSPNGDAEGEYWEVEGIEEHPTYQVSIYDRYGQLLYQAKPYANNWDGTYQGRPLPTEAYFFAIREVTSGKLLKAGSLTLVR